MTRAELNRRNGFIDGTATVRSYPAKPFPWSLVTGRDFGRAIRWSKARGNEAANLIREKLTKQK